MEKQHNRGQDGAGVATVKLHTEPGVPFMHRIRSSQPQPIGDVFGKIRDEIAEIEKYQPEITKYPGLMKGHVRFLGELLMGHLRYATQGKNNVELCHPFVRYNTIPARNLSMAGNFNLVNVEELFNFVKVSPGETHKNSDLAAMLEVVAHFLNKEDEVRQNGLDVKAILQQAFGMFDGGYHVCGLIGSGDSFVIRDPHGIRPSYYYINDDVIVAASERAAIRTTFNVGENEVMELMPGTALIVKENGEYSIEQIIPAKERRACSFERIYFSRGNDEKIYKERSALGYHLSETVLKAIDNDLPQHHFLLHPQYRRSGFLRPHQRAGRLPEPHQGGKDHELGQGF